MAHDAIQPRVQQVRLLVAAALDRAGVREVTGANVGHLVLRQGAQRMQDAALAVRRHLGG
jgi:hypothetical protein